MNLKNLLNPVRSICKFTDFKIPPASNGVKIENCKLKITIPVLCVGFFLAASHVYAQDITTGTGTLTNGPTWTSMENYSTYRV